MLCYPNVPFAIGNVVNMGKGWASAGPTPPSLCFLTEQHTILIQSMTPTTYLLPQYHIGEQTPASFFLAPNLAVRYGFTPQEEVPSYLIRVWPRGQGHHVVYNGFAQMSPQNKQRRLPAHLMYNYLLAS